jgi:hypothetical protein
MAFTEWAADSQYRALAVLLNVFQPYQQRVAHGGRAEPPSQLS